MTTHGGARPGSGPKPKEKGGADYGFRLYPSDLESIALAQHRYGCNRSAALREIIAEWRQIIEESGQ